MKWLGLALALGCGCGRVGFDGRVAPRDGQVPTDDATDGAMVDVTPGIDAGLPAGLVDWYPFEQLLKDMAGTNDGTCVGAACPTLKVAHRGMGYLFDGVDDCIDVPDIGSLQLPQLTIAIWAEQNVGGTLSHVSKKVGGGSVNSWQLETEALGMPANSLSFTTYDNSGLNQYARTPMNSIELGTWQHLAATYDGATKRVYIDGVEMANMAQATAIPYDTNPMLIGCDDNAPRAEFFAGMLDDLQIYNRALSAAEIADLAAR